VVGRRPGGGARVDAEADAIGREAVLEERLRAGGPLAGTPAVRARAQPERREGARKFSVQPDIEGRALIADLKATATATGSACPSAGIPVARNSGNRD
jgi:hypothetical protein